MHPELLTQLSSSLGPSMSILRAGRPYWSIFLDVFPASPTTQPTLRTLGVPAYSLDILGSVVVCWGGGSSCINSHTYNDPRYNTLASPLGTQMEVYDAELYGIRQAAEHALKFCRRTRNRRDIWIFTDNQAAVMRVATLKPGPGQE